MLKTGFELNQLYASEKIKKGKRIIAKCEEKNCKPQSEMDVIEFLQIIILTPMQLL